MAVNPEVSLEAHETSERYAAYLEARGFGVERGVASPPAEEIGVGRRRLVEAGIFGGGGRPCPRPHDPRPGPLVRDAERASARVCATRGVSPQALPNRGLTA
jgi:hypothetical protein